MSRRRGSGRGGGRPPNPGLPQSSRSRDASSQSSTGPTPLQTPNISRPASPPLHLPHLSAHDAALDAFLHSGQTALGVHDMPEPVSQPKPGRAARSGRSLLAPLPRQSTPDTVWQQVGRVPTGQVWHEIERLVNYVLISAM